MKKLFIIFLMIAAFAALSFNVFAAGTAEQLVTFTIGASNELSVSGAPGLLEILAAAAGEDPIPVTDSNTSISY